MKKIIISALQLLILFIQIPALAQSESIDLNEDGYLNLKWPTYSKELEKASKVDDKALVDLAICYGFGLGVKMDEKKCNKIFRENFGFNTTDIPSIAKAQPYASMWWGIFIWEQASYGGYYIKKLKWDKEHYGLQYHEFGSKFQSIGLDFIEYAAEGGLEMAQLLYARVCRGSTKYQRYWYSDVAKSAWYVGYYELANKWYSEACQHGNPYIMFEYAEYLNYMIANHCSDIPDIYNLTVYCYKQAAEHGHPASHHMVGKIYENGYLSQPQNSTEAMNWYRKGITNGDLPSHYHAAKLLISKNDPEAIELLKKGSELKDAQSTYLLGMMYRNGNMVERNLNMAFDLLGKSLELGSLSGTYEYAYCYDQGIGCEKDLSIALAIYTKLAESDLSFPERKKMIERLAIMYETGDGVFRNVDKAQYYRNILKYYE